MLKNEELILVKGGGLTSTLINAISRIVNTLFELGQAVGSAIRRSSSKKICKLS